MTTSPSLPGLRLRDLRVLGLAGFVSVAALLGGIGAAMAQTQTPAPAATDTPPATQPAAPCPGAGPCGGVGKGPGPGMGPGTGPGMRQGRPNQFHRSGGLFARLDTDKSGTVSKAEYMTFRDQRFQTFDTNKDGRISLEEFYNAERPGRGRNPEQRKAAQAQRFKATDKDGDGFIAKAEWDAQSDALFAALDKNHDGNLTADELGPRMGRRGRG